MANDNNPNKGSGTMNDIAVLLKDMASNSFDYMSGKYRAKSIAERARKSIMMYKVGVSASVGDLEVATKIGKYLETMYAIFTMINLGYNPVAKTGDEIAKVISSVSAESYDPTKAINMAANRSLNLAMKYKEDNLKTNKPSSIGRHATKSSESSLGYDIGRGLIDALDAEEAKKVEAEYLKNPDGSMLFFKQKSFIDGLDKAITSGVPTIVNLAVGSANDKDAVKIPLAIKANMYGITSQEIKVMIESSLKGKAFNFLRFVKWRSGEISTLAWLFNTDIAENDKKLYKSLGRNPWYIDLMKRKAAAKSTSFAKFAVNSSSADVSNKELYKAVKEDIKDLKDLPPTASLIVTKNDLTTATNLDITHFTKNEGLLKNIMKNLYLLCFGIVDPDTDTIQFFFDGYTQPFYLKFSDLNKTKDPNQSLYEALKELAKRS